MSVDENEEIETGPQINRSTIGSHRPLRLEDGTQAQSSRDGASHEKEVVALDHLPSLPARHALIAAWHSYLDRQASAGQIASNTTKTYKRGLDKFLSWGIGRTVCRRLVLDWIADLRKSELSPGTINTWLFSVRAFFDWAVSEGIYPANPTAGVKSIRRRARGHKRGILSNGEMRRLLSLELSARDQAILHLLAYTGCRAIELIRADLEDLIQVGDRQVLRVQGKGRQEKDEEIIIAHPTAQEVLYRYLSARGGEPGPLFRSYSDRSFDCRLSLRALQLLVKSAFRLAGIVSQDKTVHSLRHTACTAAIRRGAQVQDVQAMMRHSSPATTMIYYHREKRLANPAEAFVAYEETGRN